MEEITADALCEAAGLLGIGNHACLNEIHSRYHERIKEWHPDVSQNDPASSHEIMIQLKKGFDLLVDYYMIHSYSFRIEDLARDLEQAPADFWMERVGNDPIWG